MGDFALGGWLFYEPNSFKPFLDLYEATHTDRHPILVYRVMIKKLSREISMFVDYQY